MTKFQPSQHSYGAAAPAASTEDTDYTQYMELARQFVFGEDARTTVAELEVKLAQAQDKAKNSIWPLKSYWEGRVSILAAQLKAAREQAGEQSFRVETEKYTRVAMFVVGSVAATALMMVAWNQMEQAKVKAVERSLLMQKYGG